MARAALQISAWKDSESGMGPIVPAPAEGWQPRLVPPIVALLRLGAMSDTINVVEVVYEHC
jgi:hypothetical protein